MRSRPYGVGASEANIQTAEEQLGIKLPDSYKDFLKEFGWGGAGHLEFFGLGSDVPAHLDLVMVTLEERSLYRPYMLTYLVPLLNDGFGNHYCLDTRHIESGDCPVVFWNHELDESQIPELVAENYEKWLLDLLKHLQEQM